MEAMSTSPPNPESLLADVVFARRLARRLVRDTALADDLAQEAWLRAQDGAPRGSLQAWLGGIVRNLARQHRRSESRRARREAAAARPEALPSAAESLERLAAQQDVVRAVLALPEPYRSTVVLRFHDGLPPRAIAARHGVPVATVKTRLARGLAQLRAALAKEHGGEERALAVVLLPLVRGGTLVPWLATTMVMNLPTKLALAAALVLGVFWVARRGGGERAEPPVSVAASEVEIALERPEVEQASAAARVAQATAGRATTTPETTRLEASTAVRGIVLDAQGQPVGGVELGRRNSNGVRFPEGPIGGHLLWSEPFPEGSPLAVSGPDGRFELEGTGTLVISVDRRWETVLAPSMLPDEELVLVVAPLVRIGGRVTDAAGTPLAGVDVRFDVPMGRLALAGLDLAPTELCGWEATTDVQGRYAFERLPAVPGARLFARRAPYELARVERELWESGELDVVLEEPRGERVEGRVEARGAPVPGATVALGYRATRTDEHGRFRLPLSGIERAEELCVAAPGFAPERVPGDVSGDGSVRWPAVVRVTLVDEALAFSGRVLDVDGEPLADQQVALVDPTVLHADERGFPVLLESALAGAAEMEHRTTTDASGAFALQGLDEREYRLRVVDSASALVFEAGPFGAGERDLVLQRPADALWERVRGVVVGSDGLGIAGVQVAIERDVDYVAIPDQTYYGIRANGARCTTGEDGAFELFSVPRSGAELHVRGANVSDPELALTPDIDPDALRVVCYRRAALEVICAAPTAAWFSVLDESGEALELWVKTGAGYFTKPSVELENGRSPVVTVSDAGAWLVVSDGAVELVRVPLALQATGINRVDL
jgi:RNA polymerase sigma-70 factor (ECF subfamily)